MSYPRHLLSRSFTHTTYTGGNYTLTSTSWAAIDNSNLPLSLYAQDSDVLEIGINGLWGSENQTGSLDVVTYVDGIVNWVGGAEADSGNYGIVGWYGPPNVISPVSGSMLYTVGPADIEDDGIVSLRLMYRVTGSRTFYASTTHPLHWYAKNIGPAAT